MTSLYLESVEGLYTGRMRVIPDSLLVSAYGTIYSRNQNITPYIFYSWSHVDYEKEFNKGEDITVCKIKIGDDRYIRFYVTTFGQSGDTFSFGWRCQICDGNNQQIVETSQTYSSEELYETATGETKLQVQDIEFFLYFINDTLYCNFNGLRLYDGTFHTTIITDLNAYSIGGNSARVTIAQINQYGKLDFIETDDTFGPPSAPGGYVGGSFDDSSDIIGIPEMPKIGVTSAGFVNVYSISEGGLTGLGEDLFPDVITPTTGESLEDIVKAIAESLINIGDMFINSQLITYVLDCHIVPVPTYGVPEAIKIGFKEFNQTAERMYSDYIDYDCGELNIAEYYSNFVDYAPYTSAKLFLPFVGFVEIYPEFFQSGTLGVYYRFNIVDGSFMAYVTSTSSKSKLTATVIAQYSGNACVHIPLTGLNYASAIGNIIGGVQGIMPSGGSGAISSGINTALSVVSQRPSLQQSNSYNATSSFLSIRVPYLMVERSVSNFSKTYNNESGIPSNISMSLGDLKGYSEIDNILFNGIDCTQTELDEITSLLQSGVIF